MKKLLSLFVALFALCSINATTYSYDFKTSQQGWTISNVSLDGLSFVWQQTSQYGMKASAYVSNVNHTTESWLVSPVLNLSGNTSATLQFNHARRYGSNNDLSVRISRDGGNTWRVLSFPNWPNGNNWTFIDAGTVDISAYISSSTKIAFVYTSTSAGAATWEISDVQINTNTTTGGGSTISVSISDDCSKNGTTTDVRPSSGVENGYTWVNMGLSVMWATINVGATNPEDYGNYYAWGEVTPKTDYSWSTYKYCNGSSSSMTKYCTSSSYGTVDNKTTLEPADDAAHVNWGGNWRMPTEAERAELCYKCTWTWTTQNGVNGYRVTASNGNAIFLPAAGYRDDTDLSNAGSRGYYWSSSLNTNHLYNAYIAYFHSSSEGSGSYFRRSGLSVRPVCP